MNNVKTIIFIFIVILIVILNILCNCIIVYENKDYYYYYYLVIGILGIALVITKLSNIMLLRKIQDYLTEDRSSIIAVLVNLRKVHKFDLF